MIYRYIFVPHSKPIAKIKYSKNPITHIMAPLHVYTLCLCYICYIAQEGKVTYGDTMPTEISLFSNLLREEREAEEAGKSWETL